MRRMRYVVERMTLADIPRVVEIERLAYTTPWPPSAYRKELQDNPLAHYIVLSDTTLQAPAPQASAGETPRRGFPLLGGPKISPRSVTRVQRFLPAGLLPRSSASRASG